MPLAPDIVDYLTQHWERIAPDIKQHLADQYGFGVSKTTTPTTPAESLQTGLFEAAGGIGGGLINPALAGPSMAAAGALEDVIAGRPFSEQRAERRVLGGYTAEYGGAKVQEIGGPLIRAGMRKVAERFPSLAEFIEGGLPGVLKRGERALKATGELGTRTPEQVAEGFKQWSKAAFDHVESIVGDADVIPTDRFRSAVAQYNLTSAPSLSGAERAAFERALSDPAISFRDARQLEQGFGRLARTRLGQREMGDPISHQWSEMRRAVHADIDSYLDPDVAVEVGPHRAMRPGGAELKDTLQKYREGREMMRATALYRRATSPSGRFDPATFAQGVKTLEDKGILERVVGADRANDVRGLAAEFDAQTGGGQTLATAKRIAGRVALPAAVLSGSGYRGYHERSLSAAVEPAVALTALLHPATRPYSALALRQGMAAALQNPELRRYLSPDIDLRELAPQPPGY